MPAAELTDLLIPYWQGAKYEFDLCGRLAGTGGSLIGPSLTRLQDAK